MDNQKGNFVAAPRKNPSTALVALGDRIDSLQAAVSAELTALIEAYDKLSDILNASVAETTPGKQPAPARAQARPPAALAGRRSAPEPDEDDEPAPARRGRPPASTGRRSAPPEDEDDDIDDPPVPRRGRPPRSGNKAPATAATPARRGRPPAVPEPEEDEDDFDTEFDEPEAEADGDDDNWDQEWVEEPAKPARRGR